MMKAVIKRMTGNNLTSPGEVWTNQQGEIIHDKPELPDDIYDFSVWVSVEIGPEKEEGAHIFQFHFITQSSLKNLRQKQESGRKEMKYIILHEFSWENVEKEINALLDQFELDNFQDIATKLSEYSYWEFENYK